MELSLKDRILVKGLMIFVTLGIVFEPIISRLPDIAFYVNIQMF